MKKIFYIICSVLLFAGCSEDVDLMVGDKLTTPQENFKISARVDSGDTKVDIDGTAVKWSAGDYITIAEIGSDGTFNSSVQFYIDSESISADGKSAEFYGDGLVAGKEYIAVNGWVNIADDQEYYQQLGVVGLMFRYFSLGLYQEEESNDSHIESEWFMMSSPFEIGESNDLFIEFANKSSYMELNISMENGVEAYEVQSISFETPAQMFVSVQYLDSNCDVIYSETTDKVTSTLSDEPTISGAMGYTAYIPFMLNGEITEIEGDFTIRIITTDQKESSVTIPAKLLTENTLYTKDILFPEPEDLIASDRAALIELYNSTGGDNWTNNTNWCTDSPLSEWYGVEVNELGRVKNLYLNWNNFNGSLPESIGDLTSLEKLHLGSSSSFVGSIPESIGSLTSLKQLYIGFAGLTGSIPESIGSLTNLETLSLTWNSLTGSIPISICNLESLTSLTLSGNSLSGEIPEDIYKLTNLEHIDLSDNGSLSGSIPSRIGELTKLTYLALSCNSLSGSIPESIGDLTELTGLLLNDCDLTGTIPASLAKLTELEYCNLTDNKMSGVVSDDFATSGFNWNRFAWNMLSQQSGYKFTSLPDVYLEPSTITTVAYGAVSTQTLNTEDLFSYYDLTCVVYCSYADAYSLSYMDAIKTLYTYYESKNFNVVMLFLNTDESTIISYVSQNDIPGTICRVNGYNYEEESNNIKYIPVNMQVPAYAFVDKSGKVLSAEYIYALDPSTTREDASRAFVEEYLGEVEYYQSSDYSKDGEIMTLQTATVGDGIDLVIVGDGFIDTDMGTDGVYETRMKEAAEHFFSEEPYKTFRNRYNVYAIKAVSKNSGIYDGGETAFSSKFSEVVHIAGDDAKVFEYALKVPSIENTDDLTTIVVLNSAKYAGTCYMYSGNDASVAYCPIVCNISSEFCKVLVHEAGGHAFAKLLDEYAYEGTIPASDIESFNWKRSLGWGANVDITSDPETIQWADLLTDTRYTGLVGIYEGALTYEYGAYRPTDFSIMRYNTGGYNPPSRKEIYRRIMELSGETYSYEKFVEYDAINRVVSASVYRAASLNDVEKEAFVPLAQPVVVNGSPSVK